MGQPVQGIPLQQQGSQQLAPAVVFSSNIIYSSLLLIIIQMVVLHMTLPYVQFFNPLLSRNKLMKYLLRVTGLSC